MNFRKNIIVPFILFFLILRILSSGYSFENKKHILETLLYRAKYEKIDGKIKILISPHASLKFSGIVQAAGYKTVFESKQEFDRMIILGPSHFEYFKGFRSYRGKEMLTVFGRIRIDEKTGKEFKKHIRGFEYNNSIFEKEYSIKRQLGFIKKYRRNVKIIPIIVGDCTKYQLKQLAKKIIELMEGKERLLLIVSTDMSHYHNKKNANSLDNYAIDILSEINPDLLYRMSKSRRIEFCGWRSIYVASTVAKKLDLEFKPVLYGDSSFYNKEKVVGYLSALFYKPIKLKYDKKLEKQVLNIIKNSMKDYFKGKAYEYKGEIRKELKEKRGVFITLKKNGKLRSCIGSLTSNYPLYKFLTYVSRAVLHKDKRFEPIKEKELNSLQIEVSIIYDYGRLYSVRKFKLGTDGLYIIKGEKRGVLLPQVATEFGLTKKRFLMKLCEKASLKPRCYKDENLLIYRFKTLVFHN